MKIAPLKKNDTVAIIASAKQVDKKQMETATALLKKWGLQVISGKNLYKKSGMFAGTDQQRASDLQEAMNNPAIKAIFCARGGYGTARIIDTIELKHFRKNPKWVIGFSDVTVLHNTLHNKGIPSIHGLMPLVFDQKGSKESLTQLQKTLFGAQPSYQ